MEAQVRKVPEITPEQRSEALARANELRHRRAELLGMVKRGEMTPAEFVAEGDAAGGTRALRFVEGWPGYGRARASKLLARLGIGERRRLRGLGRRQREALAEAMAEFEGGE